MDSSRVGPERRTGPLTGVRIVEFAGLGPAPFAATLLADMGADVIRIARLAQEDVERDYLLRSRRTVYLDLKVAADLEAAHRLIGQADALIEGFRPEVMERLGLGPDEALQANPRLVYARMTGWGQDGPLAWSAGHDINYIAITGALHAMRSRRGGVVPPLNVVGDYGGGSLYLVAGILAALLESKVSGKGQVVDCAICDGVVSMMGLFQQFWDTGRWTPQAQENFLDGGAPFYAVYECADGKSIAVGAIEPKFYAAVRRTLGLAEPIFDRQHDRAAWPEQRERLAAVIATRTRDEWTALFAGIDACVAPVLDLEESRSDPHLSARGAYVDVRGRTQPAPAPRFSRTPARVTGGAAVTVDAALAAWSRSSTFKLQ